MGRLVNVIMLVWEIEFLLVGLVFAASGGIDRGLGRR